MSEMQTEEKARAFGFQGFFHKPFDTEAVLDGIKRASGESPPAP